MRIAKFIATLLLLTIKILAQQRSSLTIEDALRIAMENSSDIKVIKNEFLSASLGYLNFKRSDLPQFSLNVNGSYKNAIQEVQQSDGSVVLSGRNYMTPTVGLNITQLLPFTGGQLTFSNTVNAVRDYKYGRKSFSSDWFNVEYAQTVNGFNQFKWDKKKNYYQRKVDSIRYKKEIATLKRDISSLYLNAYLLQLKKQLITSHIEVTTLLLNQLKSQQAQQRVIELELDQTRILLNQLQQEAVGNRYDFDTTMALLRYRLNMTDNHQPVELKPVGNINFTIDKEHLLSAIMDNDYTPGVQLNLIILDETIDKIRREGAVQGQLKVGYGMNSSSTIIDRLYISPDPKYMVSIGMKVPIINWHIEKNKLKIAMIELENMSQSIADRRYRLTGKVDNMYYNLQSLNTQIHISEEELSLQKKTSELVHDAFLMGRQTIYDYRTQLYEYDKTVINYNILLIKKYLLKLEVDEIVS